MFSKSTAILAVALSALSSTVSAVPLSGSGLFSRTDAAPSFNNWHGISSLSGFDDFYGSDNFANSHFSQSSITVVKEKQVVCHSQSAHIIQQRLLVLQELAKR